MTMAATAPARRARPTRSGSRPLVVPLLAAVIALLAVVGGVLAVQMVRAGAGTDVTATGASAHTSFGSVAVHQSEVLNGLTSSSLGGMSHGISGLVKAGQAEIAVTVTLTNTDKRSVRYAADQFRLRAGAAAPTGTAIAPGGTSLSSGELSRGGTVEGTLSFVTPVNGSHLWLQFADGGHLITLPLSATAKDGSSVDGNAPAAPGDQHPGH